MLYQLVISTTVTVPHSSTIHRHAAAAQAMAESETADASGDAAVDVAPAVELPAEAVAPPAEAAGQQRLSDRLSGCE